MVDGSSIVFSYDESDFDNRISKAFGRAVRILAGSQRSDLSISSISKSLWPAVMLNQILFLYNSKGTPVAYLSWAYLTPEVCDLLDADPSYVLDISEWNEGDRFWVMDIVAPSGDLRALVRKLRSLHLPDLSQVYGLRRRRSVALTVRTKRTLPC